MKLHLPKQLFTALLTAITCTLPTEAATYYLNSTTNSNLSGSFAESSGGTPNSVHWHKFCSLGGGYNGPHTLVIDQARAVNQCIMLDFSPFTAAALQVSADAAGTWIGNNNGIREFHIGDNKVDAGEQSSSFNGNLKLQGTLTKLVGTQTWTIDNGVTVELAAGSSMHSLQNTGTATISGGSLTISGGITNDSSATLTLTGGNVLTIGNSIINNGTMEFTGNSKLQISSLENFDFTLGEIDYSTGGLTTVSKDYVIYTGNTISGLSTFTLVGETEGRDINSSGIYKGSIVAYVVANGETATVSSAAGATQGTGDAEVYAVAEGGTLIFADTILSDFSETVLGDGRVEVTLVTPDSNHSRGVKFGNEFQGTLAVNSGWMDLTTFVLGSNATIELHSGQHWSNGGSVSQAISLLATEADQYIFRNSNTLRLSGTVTGNYLDLGTTFSDSGVLMLAGSGNNIGYINVGSDGTSMGLTISGTTTTKRINSVNTASTITISSGQNLTINGGTEEGDNESTIAKLSASGATVTLASGVTLNLGSNATATESTIGTVVAGSDGSTIHLNNKATLNTISKGATSGTITLTGGGVYSHVVPALSSSSASYNSPVKLHDTDWTGTVQLSGGNGNVGLASGSLSTYTTSNSKLELKGLHAYAVGDVTPAFILTNKTDDSIQNISIGNLALRLDNGSSNNNHTATFKKAISGTGSMAYIWTRCDSSTPDVKAYHVFEGDTSQWDGWFMNYENSGKYVEVKFTKGGQVFAKAGNGGVIDRRTEGSSRLDVVINAPNGDTTEFYGSIENARTLTVSTDTEFHGKKVTTSSLVSSAAITVGEGVTMKVLSSLSGLSADNSITLEENAILDLTQMNISLNFESVIKATEGAGVVKFMGTDTFPAGDENEETWRVSPTAPITLNTNVSVEKSMAVNMGSTSGNKVFDVNEKTLTVGGDLRFENHACLKVASGEVKVAGSILLGHQSTGYPGHIELSGGKITTGTVAETNADDSNATLTMSGGELKLTQADATISGIKAVISGGTLIADTASWGIEGTGVDSSSLGNVTFDIAEEKSITLSGSWDITGALTLAGAGELVFNTDSLTMSEKTLNSLSSSSTEVAANTNGLSKLKYQLVNIDGTGTLGGTANNVVVGDTTLTFDKSTGAVFSNKQAFVINTQYSTDKEDAATLLPQATLGVNVTQTGTFTIAGNVTESLTASELLNMTSGTGVVILEAEGFNFNKESLGQFFGSLQIGSNKTLVVNDSSQLLDMTNLREIELLENAMLNIKYGTGMKANTIKLNQGSTVKLENGAGNYTTLEAGLLLAGNANLTASTYGHGTRVLGSISGNGTLSINKISDNTWVLGSEITDGNGAEDSIALHFVSAPTGDKYIHITGDNSFSGGTTISAGNVKTAHVNALGSGNVTVDKSGALILESDLFIQGKLTGSGSVTVQNSATLILSGGTASNQQQHSIGTINAASAGVTLGDYATLTLGGGTAETQVTHSIGTLTGDTDSMLNLAQHAVLDKVSSITNVTLTGNGTYNYGSHTQNSDLTFGFTVDEKNWKGTVKITGGGSTAKWGTLSALGNEYSWISLSGVCGYLAPDGEIERNLIFEAGKALDIQNGSSDYASNTFKGILTGDGDFEFSGWNSRRAAFSYYFTGNIAGWSGQFNNDSDTGYAVNVHFEQEGTEETPAQIFKADAQDETVGVKNSSTANNLNVHIGKAGAHDKVVQFNGLISGVNELNVNNQATFGRNVGVSTVKVAHNATARFDSTLTAKSAQLYENVTVGESTETRLVASITGKQDSDATMSKVQMSSTGISGTATDGTSSISAAEIEVLAADASFTIADMTLTNTSITAAETTTRVNLSNVSVGVDSVVTLAKGAFAVQNQATVGMGGGEVDFTTSSYSGFTLGTADSKASITLNLGDLSQVKPMGPGVYESITILLAGFHMTETEGNASILFAADSWLGQLLTAQGANDAYVSGSLDAPASVSEGGSGSSVNVSYSTGNVGTIITITGLNVPEPTTSTLSLLALAALAARRRRK